MPRKARTVQDAMECARMAQVRQNGAMEVARNAQVGQKEPTHRPRREPLRYATYTYYPEIPRTRTISSLQKPGGLVPTEPCQSMGYNQSLSFRAVPDPVLVTVTDNDPESLLEC